MSTTAVPESDTVVRFTIRRATSVYEDAAYLDIPADSPVQELREKIQQSLGIPIERQLLVCNGKRVVDEDVARCADIGAAKKLIFVVESNAAHRHPHRPQEHIRESKGEQQSSSEELLQHADTCAEAYDRALSAHGLRIRRCRGDGNCLFRSIAHQVYGREDLHALIRSYCCSYMEANAEHFALYTDTDFPRYIAEMRQDGVWGGHPEICAMAEIYRRPVELWSYDSRVGARPLPNTQLGSAFDAPAIRLSYFRGGHYDSMVGRGWESALSRMAPGEHEDEVVALARSGTDEDLRHTLELSRRAYDNTFRERQLDTIVADVMLQSDAEFAENQLLASTLRVSEQEDVKEQYEQMQEHDLASAVAQSERDQLDEALRRSKDAASGAIVESSIDTLQPIFPHFPRGLLRHALSLFASPVAVDAEASTAWLFENGEQYLNEHLDLYRD
eukprot:g5451.t1